MTNDLNIPTFLKRKPGDAPAETKAPVKKPEEKPAKNGVAVVPPPDKKETAAAAKKFAEKAKADKLAKAKKAVTKAKVPKKAGKLVEKAIKARDELAAKAKAISAANGKAPAKPKAKSSGRYDWMAAEEAAAKGTVPTTPDFSANTHKCYRPRLAEIEKLVKKGDVKALKAMKDSDFRKDGSPLIMNRYRKLAITALEAKQGR